MVKIKYYKNGHESSSNILSDYCDGSTFESHPLYSKEKNSSSIQIYFYFEICNPLGPKTKIHKLGMQCVRMETYLLA